MITINRNLPNRFSSCSAHQITKVCGQSTYLVLDLWLVFDVPSSSWEAFSRQITVSEWKTSAWLRALARQLRTREDRFPVLCHWFQNKCHVTTSKFFPWKSEIDNNNLPSWPLLTDEILIAKSASDRILIRLYTQFGWNDLYIFFTVCVLYLT